MRPAQLTPENREAQRDGEGAPRRAFNEAGAINAGKHVGIRAGGAEGVRLQ